MRWQHLLETCIFDTPLQEVALIKQAAIRKILKYIGVVYHFLEALDAEDLLDFGIQPVVIDEGRFGHDLVH